MFCFEVAETKKRYSKLGIERIALEKQMKEAEQKAEAAEVARAKAQVRKKEHENYFFYIFVSGCDGKWSSGNGAAAR